MFESISHYFLILFSFLFSSVLGGIEFKKINNKIIGTVIFYFSLACMFHKINSDALKLRSTYGILHLAGAALLMLAWFLSLGASVKICRFLFGEEYFSKRKS